jgi:hypothetical protein
MTTRHLEAMFTETTEISEHRDVRQRFDYATNWIQVNMSAVQRGLFPFVRTFHEQIDVRSGEALTRLVK